MVKKSTYACPRKACLYQTKSKFQYKKHLRNCQIKAKARPEKRSKFEINLVDVSQIKIVKRVGNGGFGDIYLAKVGQKQMIAKRIRDQQHFQRQKEFYSSLNQEEIQYFPYYYGSFEAGNKKILFMQKLDGDCQVINFDQNIPKDIICHIISQIIFKLSIVHNKGFVHRDLKPNNFMFKGNCIYLIDFGFTRNFTLQLKKGKVAGSLSYLSINSHSYFMQTPRDDIESMIYILIKALTKSLPWQWIVKDYQNKIIPTDVAMEQIKKSKLQYLNSSVLRDFTPQNCFQLLKYITNLGIKEKIDYQYLIKTINAIPQQSAKTENFAKLLARQKPKFQNIGKNILAFCQTDSNNQHKSPQSLKQYLVQMDKSTINVIDLSTNLLKKYQTKQRLSNLIIQGELREINILYNVHYRYFPFTTIKYFQLMASENNSDDSLFLVYNSFQEHFFVMLKTGDKTGNKIISFNGLNDCIPMKKSKYLHLQKDDWSCGYIAFLWIKKIINFGIQKWAQIQLKE